MGSWGGPPIGPPVHHDSHKLPSAKPSSHPSTSSMEHKRGELERRCRCIAMAAYPPEPIFLRLNSTLILAAKTHVGKSKIGRHTKPWSTPERSVILVIEATLTSIPTLLPPASTFHNADLRGLFSAEVEHRGEVHYLPVRVVRKGQHANLLERNCLNRLPALLSYTHGVHEN